MTPEVKRAAREAHRRAADLERQILARYPGAWQIMDRMRTDPPTSWPDWCLLPMAAAAAVATSRGYPTTAPPPVAALSALYAWRYSRSVYIVEPTLLGRLLGQVPDDVSGPQDLVAPEWCTFVAAAHPEWPGVGVWMHLEYDANTGRPELRLLLDAAGEGGLESLVVIPVYLDRPTLTEGLADFLATGMAAALAGAAGQPRTGMDVRGAAMDAWVAQLADRVDGYVSVLAYLARPEADVVSADRPGVRPVRGRSPVRDRSTWLVGFSG